MYRYGSLIVEQFIVSISDCDTHNKKSLERVDSKESSAAVVYRMGLFPLDDPIVLCGELTYALAVLEKQSRDCDDRHHHYHQSSPLVAI